MTGGPKVAGPSTLSHILVIIKKNPIARVAILVGLVFLITYGGMAVARVAMKTESPIMVVPSTSMVPTLNVGDIVIVKGVDPNTITVGTIIIFRSPSGSIDIIHRVIGIIKEGNTLYFQTKGDHNSAADPWSPGVPEANGSRTVILRASNEEKSPLQKASCGMVATIVRL